MNINKKDNINTTININPLILTKINEVSSLFKISTTKIITLLIIKTKNKIEIEPTMFESVKYQKKNKTIKWRKLHVSYDKGIYETALDLRKIFKRSVSRIVAEGVEEFLDEIVRELCKDKNIADNYPCDYILRSNYYNKIFYFTIFWDIPPLKFLKKFML